MITQQQVEKLWPLSGHFEYSSEIGLGLRMGNVALWKEFVEQHPDLDERYPLIQAQGLLFMLWLENNCSGEQLQQLKDAVLVVLQRSSSAIKNEVRASERYLQLAPSTQLNDQIEIFFSGKVHLFAPPRCLNYQKNRIDGWTESALSAADICQHQTTPLQASALFPAHTRSYAHKLLQFAERGGGLLTPETLVTADSAETVLAAAGAACDAVDWALEQQREYPAILRVHPGSHHASSDRAGGTCLVNNLAVAALYAHRQKRKSRIAVLDIDAHHGNGTEEIFIQNNHVLTVSVHQADFYPGTGQHTQRGYGVGEGFNVNLPLQPDLSATEWESKCWFALRKIRAFNPHLLLIQLSTDAHQLDPISQLNASTESFLKLGQQVAQMGKPTVVELGASLSQQAWIEGLQAFLQGFSESS